MTEGGGRDPAPLRRPPLELPDPPLTDAASGIALRPWRPTPGDVGALVGAWADPEITAWTAVPDDPSTAAAERWIRGEPIRRAAGLCLDLVVAPLMGPGVSRRPPAVGQAEPLQADNAGRAGGAVLGEVGLHNITAEPRRAEIGWWIAAPHRGRGLGVAATRLLADWALSSGGGFVQVWARIDPPNTASARVAAAAGFVELGSAGGRAVWARTRPRGTGASDRPPS